MAIGTALAIIGAVAATAGAVTTASQANRANKEQKRIKAIAASDRAAAVQLQETEAAEAQAEKDRVAGLPVEDPDKKRRARLLSGVRTTSLGVDPEEQTVGRARLLG